jgi:predicted acylesterase/phospholipase RssA
MSTESPAAPAGKLGLSLAGGGFRASLFHVGVLRRLAELDVLRRVEVLSTVSGGSITGALYVLLLKKHLEAARRTDDSTAEAPVVALTRAQYVALTGELEHLLVRGVQKNLRTRLLMNPLGTLLVMLTGDSLGRRMARLYERHLLRDVVAELAAQPPAPWWKPRWLWPGQMRMKDLVVRPAGEPIRGGLASYNARQRTRGGSAVTSIVVNATSLNSGGRFYFSAVEIGDWYLGYFRESEFGLLLARKALVGMSDFDLERVALGGTPPHVVHNDVAYEWQTREAAHAATLELRRRGSQRALAEDVWKPLFAMREFPGQLEQAAFGVLRPAKLAAWYLRHGRLWTPPVLGGQTPEQHTATLWSVVRTIDPDLAAHLESAALRDPVIADLLADYILELYWLRSAECMSHNIADNWDGIRVGHAVGASACFPPVFPPFLVYGVYDDLHVPRLGLTDGGVYDNMGVTALVDEGCTEIIASDTSGLFNTTPASTNGHVGLALRVPDLLMRVLGGVQRSGLRERRRVSRRLAELAAPADGEPSPLQQQLASFRSARALDALVYFHIASPRVEPADPLHADGAAPALHSIGVDPLDVAGLRTDLDGFGDVEVAALINHGYDMADRYVRRYAPELVGAAAAGSAPRMPRPFDGPNATPQRAGLILRIGSARFFRALKLRSALAWSFAVVAAAGLVTLLWRSQLTLERGLHGITALVQAEIALLDRMTGWVPGLSQPASREPIALSVVAAVALLLLLLIVSRRPRARTAHAQSSSTARRLMTIRKWLRALSGNVLWVLLGLPALIAAASALLATVSYVFFHLPFMRALRLRRREERTPTPVPSRASPSAVTVGVED